MGLPPGKRNNRPKPSVVNVNVKRPRRRGGGPMTRPGEGKKRKRDGPRGIVGEGKRKLREGQSIGIIRYSH